jgi:hypothetical protein
MIGNILILVITMIFLIKKYQKGLFVIIVISLFNDLFEIPLIDIKYYQFIVLIYSPKIIMFWFKESGCFKRQILPIIIEYYYLIIIGVIFGFLFPWKGNYDHLRLWSQLSEGRTIVQLIRFFSDILLIILVFHWFRTKSISISFLVNSLSIILTISVIIAVIDGLTGYPIRQILFGEQTRLIEGRFIGLCGEPRGFGKICSFGLLLLLVMKNRNYYFFLKTGIIFSIVGIVISFSASTYILTVCWIIILLVYRVMKFNVVSFITFSIIIAGMFYLISNVDFFQKVTLTKIDKVIGGSGTAAIEKVGVFEPDIFTRFEVFDRAALNFLYREPLYFITGVGPNLISIPSSPYLTRATYAIYGENIDSVPHSFLINLISRSGIIGFSLWIIFFINIYGKLRKEKIILALFVSVFISNLIVNTSIFYFYLGILLSMKYIKETSND